MKYSTAPTASAFPSEVYVYVGTKTNKGSIIDRAGLTNGALYGLKITVGGQPVPEESNDFGLGTAASGFVGSGRFSLHNFGDVSALDALALKLLLEGNSIRSTERYTFLKWWLVLAHVSLYGDAAVWKSDDRDAVGMIDTRYYIPMTR
jgi:hypothetical protein